MCQTELKILNKTFSNGLLVKNTGINVHNLQTDETYYFINLFVYKQEIGTKEHRGCK